MVLLQEINRDIAAVAIVRFIVAQHMTRFFYEVVFSFAYYCRTSYNLTLKEFT